MSKKKLRGHLDLYRRVLDHALVDSDGLPCGTVDDIEVEGKPGEPLIVVALLVGPAAWAPRLPVLFAKLARLIAGSRLVRVPWSEVAKIGERITLRSSAVELGLGVTDRRAGRWLAPLPLSEHIH
jgi:sporulation protein YlmC with PRC-barrel domain